MSPLLRNEVRLRVGPRRCQASLWRAGLRPRCAARSLVHGPAEASIEQALGALVAEGHRLPRAASMCVEDEFLYYAALPAGGSWAQAQARARSHFNDLMVDAELQVQTSLAPGGHTWLAVAVSVDRVDAWRDTLAGRDIELRGLRAALFEDLWTRRADLPTADGMVALMRSEGAMLVAVKGGAIDDIAWERFDVDDPALLIARIRGYSARLAQQSGSPVAAAYAPPLIVPADAAGQASITPLALARGWRVAAATVQPEA